MELVARKADLVRELQFFQQIVERKNTIPILANVLLETDGNEITLLATDIEVALTQQLRSRGRQAGRGDAAREEALRNRARAARRRREARNRRRTAHGVTVSAERFESKMPTMPRADFPSLPKSDGGANATIKGSVAPRR